MNQLKQMKTNAKYLQLLNKYTVYLDLCVYVGNTYSDK